MNETENMLISKLVEKIKENDWDSESVHVYYDDILKIIVKHYEPDLLKILDELVKDVEFWYA